MHNHSVKAWQHEHVFLGERHEQRERRTWFVVGLTSLMMVAEIVGGIMYGSMALVADGWHMSTHAAALAIAALAYGFARTHAHDPRFAFGTGKLGELAGFSSAIILAMIALMIGYESVVRLIHPVAIDYNEALLIASLGLMVNLASAWLLRDDDHHHGHEDHHQHVKHHDDHNWRAAYIHVIADAMVSVLVISGLFVARSFGWAWIDPLVGIAGMFVIASWAWGLIQSSGAVLLDTVPTSKLPDLIRDRLENEGDKISDLHLWRVGPGHMAVIVSVVSDRPQAPAAYKARLRDLAGISHLTVEVHACSDHAPADERRSAADD
jgi:cation diffusion facilitator family transporter